MSAIVERALEIAESARMQRLHRKAMRHAYEVADAILEDGRFRLRQELAGWIPEDEPIVEEEPKNTRKECPRLTMKEGKFNYV